MTVSSSTCKESLLSTTKSLLLERRFREVLSFVKKPENEAIVIDNVWDLINTVCLNLKTNDLLDNILDAQICKDILCYFVDKGKPKEVIVALMEEADTFKDNIFFCVLLEPLKRALELVPGKRKKSLEWILSSLNAHLRTLPLPKDYDLEGDEKLLLDVDSAVIETCFVLESYLDFLEFFVDEVAFDNRDADNDRVIKQRYTLIMYLLILLDHPLLYHDLHVEDEKRPKSNIRLLCERLLKCLLKICKNVFSLFAYDRGELAEESEADFVSPLSLANFSYLTFAENMTDQAWPLVFNHKYIFSRCIKYILLLLGQNVNLVIFKGLYLLQALLDRLSDFQLEYDCIELVQYTDLSKVLSNVAIYSKAKSNRLLATKAFMSYIDKYDWKGRYYLIMYIISNIEQPAIHGSVISLYRSYVHICINEDPTNKFILGESFTRFVRKVCVLSRGVETDLVDASGSIIASLNFLKYVFMRDAEGVNLTGIWDMKSFIKDSYLEPLLTSINMSRAHYKEALTNPDLDMTSASVSVTVLDEELKPVDQELQKKEIIERAFLTFNLIEYILKNVNELL